MNISEQKSFQNSTAQKRYPSNVNTLLNESGDMLAIGKAAKLLGVSIQTLRRWSKSGKIKSHRSPGGHRYFFKNDLKNLFNQKYLKNKTKKDTFAPKTDLLFADTTKKHQSSSSTTNTGSDTLPVHKIFLILLIFFAAMDMVLVAFYFSVRNLTPSIPYF